jgi:hypothetical protein
VVTTGDGLPGLSGGFTTPPLFVNNCTNPNNLDCASEAAILEYFMKPDKGGANGKATQTSGMEYSRENFNLGVDGVKTVTAKTMLKPSASTRILGGAQFNTRFSDFAVQEGCYSRFPPDKAHKPAACTIPKDPWASQDVIPVDCIPQACMVGPGVNTTALKASGFDTFGQVKKLAPSNLISPEQAAFNVLGFYFDQTPSAGYFGRTTGSTPLKYLQIYYQDIQYATDNAGNPAHVGLL